MADDAIPERNVDRVGGIIAAAAFGAVRNDPLLNKRGYITNAVSFWLMMLGALLLIARWESSRRGVKWGVRSWSGTGAALILCLVLGALDAAGQITWLNDPSENPKVTLKIADIGLLALACINVLFVLYFALRDSRIYQVPSVRWGFIISSLLICVRCVFWMLVGLHVLHFDEGQRRIFLFCLATIPEILVVMTWSFFPIAKYLRPQSIDGSETETLKPENILSHPTRFSSNQTSNLAGTTAAHAAPENNGNGSGNHNGNGNGNAAEQVVRLSIPNGVTATEMGNTGPRIHVDNTSEADDSNTGNDNYGTGRLSGVHSSMPLFAANTSSSGTGPAHTPTPIQQSYSAGQEQQSQSFNPWAGVMANTIATSVPNSPYYNPRLSMYPQGAQLATQQSNSYMSQQQQAQNQMQYPQTGMQMAGAGNGAGAIHMPNPGVSFLTPTPSPYPNMPGQHATFVKTPYPYGQQTPNQPQIQLQPQIQTQIQLPPNQQARMSQAGQSPIQMQSSSQINPRASQQYAQPSNPAFSDEYFKGDNPSSNSRQIQENAEHGQGPNSGVRNSSMSHSNEYDSSTARLQPHKEQGQE
ncbi:hypothetical protein IWW48_001573 [Coemansia sp. RSA 1200]|nr:hypothetical protein IWW48_001573 [Coemansia sp. RSA 1200]